LGEAAVLDFRGASEVALTLGGFEFGFELVDLLGDFLDFADFLFFLLPLGFEAGGGFLFVGEFLLEFCEALLAGGVFFFFERLPFHFELHDFAFDDVDFGRHRIEFDFQAGGGFVDEVDRFVREEAV